MEISLKNKNFPWEQIIFEGNRYSIKGHIFYNNKLSDIMEISRVLSTVFVNDGCTQKEQLDFLEHLNGNFAIIIETPVRSICIVDRVRSIPLFYYKDENKVLVSDDPYYIKSKINTKFSEENGVEFLLTGFVTGSDTLIEGIYQIEAGGLLTYDKSNNIFRISCYYRYLYNDRFGLSEEKLLSELDSVLIRVFERLIGSTIKKGKRIVIPLSGGLDSRIIAAMLKKLGVEDVICFTYGKKNDPEAEISRQVATSLGYEWYFVEYTNKKWYECYHSLQMKDYEKYSSSIASMPHRQDFLAVKELKDNGLIPDNSVFVPGHTGDMIAGSHIPAYYLNNGDFNFDIFLKDNLEKHYRLWDWDNNLNLRHIFAEKIKKTIGDMDISDNESCANAIELFDVKERQSKFIINSVRAYEFFEYEWRIPLWDIELMDFFLRTPIRYKIGQALYRKYARERLFIDDLEHLGNINCTTGFKISKQQIKRKKILDTLYRVRQWFIIDVRWGRYFKHPMVSLFFLKIRNCNAGYPYNYPLLKFIIDTRNKKKNNINLIGFETLYYLSKKYLYE